MTELKSSERKAFDAYEKACNGSPLSAWTIVDGQGQWVATVVRKNGARLRAFVLTNRPGEEGGRTCIQGSAGGGGYDKFAAALDGITIRDQNGNEVTFCDHGSKAAGPPDPGRIYPDQHHGWHAHCPVW